MSSPIIRQLKDWASEPADWTILDAPPGTACPVIATLRGVDAAVLVTEPTPFGLHDLNAAVGVTRELGIPAGVVINRDDLEDRSIEAYCEEQGLPILLRIPFARSIAESIAAGELLVERFPEWRERFVELAARIEELVS